MENLVKQILGQFFDFRFRAWPQNWLLKFLSFIFAFFLWYFVVGEDKVDISISIPIEIVNLPRDLTISKQYKKYLEVTINGPRGRVRSLSKQNFSRPVDLSKAKPGQVVVRNEPETVPFPRGITVLRIQPATTTIHLERLVNINLPFRAITYGDLPEGLELLTVQFQPDSIKATGPENILGKETFIATHPIDLSTINGSITVPVSLDLSPELINLIGEFEVEAQITVREKDVELAIPEVLVEFKHEGERTTYWLTPSAVKVQVALPYFMLKNTQNPASLLTARIETQGLSPGAHDLPVSVVSRIDGVRVINYSPKKIAIIIGRENSPKKIKPLPKEEQHFDIAPQSVEEQ